MSNRDKLVIKKDSCVGSGWKPVTVSVKAYQTITALAKEANMPISKVTCMPIEFAAERVVIED